MSTAVLDKVLAAVAAQQAEAETSFRTLAELIGAGDEPTAADVAEILAAAHKTAADLRAAVGVVERRRELRDRIDTEPTVRARQDELRRLIEAADQALADANMEHGRRVVPLLSEMERLDQEVREIGRAKSEWWGILPAEVKAGIERLRQAAQHSRDEAIEAGKQIQGFEAILQHAERDVFEGDTPETRERLQRAQEALAQARLTAAERDAEAAAALATFQEAEAAAVA